jgi:predicted O-methyltransferase YrrM
MKSLVKKYAPEWFLRTYRNAKHGRFEYLRLETGGLLDVAVYQHLFNVLKAAEDLDVIEVGGAAGTATISMGWGMKASGKRSKIIVIEKCVGGTRDQFGGYQSNLDRFHRFTKAFGVEKRVKLYPHYLTLENGPDVLRLVSTEQLSAIFLDADGYIHRDFYIFWPRLVPRGHIIIDDYHPSLSPKHALTYRLLNRIMEWGLFEPVQIVGTTYFGLKPQEARFESLDLREAEKIVADTCDEFQVVFDKFGLHKVSKHPES